MNVYLVSLGAFTAYELMAFAAAKLLGLDGSDFWILFGALTALGAVGAAAFTWFKMRRQQASSGASPAEAGSGSGEVDLVIKDAEAKLAASRLAHGASFSSLPAIFLLGDEGSTKTSVVLHSGLEPELLAGHVYQDNNLVASTRSANLWFAKGMVLAEAGAAVRSDSGAWIRMVRRLRPGSLKSIAGAGGQAPRAAVVCVSCELLAAADQVASLSRNLQARLGEISQVLGISFPVYVLFTKADRLSCFGDYVRNLSNEETTQVLGATLPMRQQQTSGVYAEEETQRLNAAFDGLFHSLCDKRLDFLPRENDLEKVPGAYEFPREFRKIRGAVVQFLVDLCRPSQLRASPFLRGFYFSGVRPVMVTESAPVQPQPQRVQPHSGGATGMFSVPQFQQAAPQTAQYASARKVPQWVFLGHLFNTVIANDRNAMGASAASTKTSAVQRLLLALACLACLVLSIGFTVSWMKNRAMVNQAVAAAEAIPASEAAGNALPSADALSRLETLRQALEQITRYERDGAPLGMRWGLYAGSDAYPHVRRIYYTRFGQLLFGNTQAGLLATLQRLPAAPGPADDYGFAYDTLKGYLITTSNHDKSTRQFLSPLLLARWSANRGVDAERMQLAQKQFDFYSEDLRLANPFTSANDGSAVERARRYLAQFSGAERVYQFMLAEAGKTHPAVNYNRKFPGSAEVVVNNRDVPGAFTKGGFDFMQNAIKRADQFFGGERWVLGDYAGPAVDRVKLEQDLQARYTADFIAQWRNYIRNSAVVRYANLKDAARKLNLQSGNQSPILALFWLASQNTGVASPKITEALQPVHFVVPPANADRYVAPSNQPYMNALVTLQTAIDQAANAPGTPDPGTVGMTLQNASGAKVAVKQVAQGFRIDQEAHLEASVQKLMEDPITYAEGLLRAMGPAELNAKGKALCAQFAAVSGKFPFNPNSAADASLAETGALLQPGSGALWGFYEMNLKNALVKQGNLYVANPSGGVALNPGFVNFFNNAARLSEALYRGGSGPHLTYTATPQRSDGVQSMTLTLDGQSMTSGGQGGAAKQFNWPGAGNAKLDVKIGQDIPPLSFDGVWAPFRLFNSAERISPAGTGWNLEWTLQVRFAGRSVQAQGNPPAARLFVDLAGAPLIFSRGAAPLSCVAQVAR